MQATPLVSVIMTVYNREKYLAEAIESVLASDYPNFELIIVDDCSADSSVAIAKKYEQQDKRITLVVNEKNLGQFGNRNHAMNFAKGEYLKWVDSDDKMFPEGISRLVNVMLEFPDADFGMYHTHEHGIPAFKLDGKDAIRKHFFERQFLTVGPGGTIIRTAFLKQLGGYPLAYNAAGDMYFNLHACCYSSIVILPFEFFFYRIHGEQELNTPHSYLYTSYTYFRDAMLHLPMGLTDKERAWFIKKNKRRFVVNLFRYYKNTRKMADIRTAIREARFTFKDFLTGIFQK